MPGSGALGQGVKDTTLGGSFAVKLHAQNKYLLHDREDVRSRGPVDCAAAFSSETAEIQARTRFGKEQLGVSGLRLQPCRGQCFQNSAREIFEALDGGGVELDVVSPDRVGDCLHGVVKVQDDASSRGERSLEGRLQRVVHEEVPLQRGGSAPLFGSPKHVHWARSVASHLDTKLAVQQPSHKPKSQDGTEAGLENLCESPWADAIKGFADVNGTQQQGRPPSQAFWSNSLACSMQSRG